MPNNKLAIATFLFMLSIATAFEPGWGLYRKEIPVLAFTREDQEKPRGAIIMDIAASDSKVIYHDGRNIKLKLHSNNSTIKFALRGNGSKYFDLEAKGNGRIHVLTDQQTPKQCHKLQNAKKYQLWSYLQKLVQDENNFFLYQCQAPFRISRNSQALQTWEAIQKAQQNRILKFMQSKSIDKKHLEIVSFGFTETLSSIRAIQHSPSLFLLSGTDDFQLSKRLSLLSIDLIGDYDYELGKWLCRNFLVYFQRELLYSGKQFFVLPEHIEVVLKYYSKTNEKERYRIESLLIGIINNILLAPVNHIQEQINYRESKKIHPTLYRMLTISFETTSPQLSAASIYTESFMPDLYYHGSSKKLQMAAAKYMWLMKVIALCEHYTMGYQSQLRDIQHLLKTMLKDDQHSKTGIYKSVVSEGKARLFVGEYSYQNLLPFAYGVTPTLPKDVYSNLTTAYGLTALPVSSKNYKSTGQYRYRGNIHLYFNYVFSSDQKQSEEIENWKKIRNMIQINWAKHNDIFTVWNTEGIGKQKTPWLKVVGVAFLSENKK